MTTSKAIFMSAVLTILNSFSDTDYAYGASPIERQSFEQSEKKYFVLSLDGGGIRGVIHTEFLRAIEERLGKKTHNIFNLAAASSTGALVAFGLLTPKNTIIDKPLFSTSEIADFYSDRGNEIFEPVSYSNSGFRKMLSSAFGLLAPRYKTSTYEQICQDIFADKKLSDLLIPTYITGLEINSGKGAYMFSSVKARKKSKNDYELWQVARATSAAPTYFKSMELQQKESDNHLNFWDGGLYANNPALLALMEAQEYFDEPNPHKFVVVSLGLGEAVTKINGERGQSLGIINGGSDIMNHMFAAQNSMTEKYLKKMLKNNYIRLNVDLDEVSIDDTSESYIQYLKDAALDALGRNEDKISRLHRLWDGQGGKIKTTYEQERENQLLENVFENKENIFTSNKYLHKAADYHITINR